MPLKWAAHIPLYSFLATSTLSLCARTEQQNVPIGAVGNGKKEKRKLSSIYPNLILKYGLEHHKNAAEDWQPWVSTQTEDSEVPPSKADGDGAKASSLCSQRWSFFLLTLKPGEEKKKIHEFMDSFMDN